MENDLEIIYQKVGQSQIQWPAIPETAFSQKTCTSILIAAFVWNSPKAETPNDHQQCCSHKLYDLITMESTKQEEEPA